MGGALNYFHVDLRTHLAHNPSCMEQHTEHELAKAQEMRKDVEIRDIQTA